MNKANAVSLTDEQRSDAVSNAIASVRIEGLEPSPVVMRLLEAYANAELSADQLQIDCLLEVKKQSNFTSVS